MKRSSTHLRFFAVFAVLVLLLSSCGGKTPTDSVVLPEEAWVLEVPEGDVIGPEFYLTSSDPERSYRLRACEGALFFGPESFHDRADNVTLTPGQRVMWTRNFPQEPDRIATGVGFDRVHYNTYIEITVLSGEDTVGYGLIAVDNVPGSGVSFELREARIEVFDEPIDPSTVEAGLEGLKTELDKYK